MRSFIVELTVSVDDDEVDTSEKLASKRKRIRSAIEDLDPSIGMFVVENIAYDD